MNKIQVRIPVKCLETGTIFPTQRKAAEWLHKTYSPDIALITLTRQMSVHLTKKLIKSNHRHKDGTPVYSTCRSIYGHHFENVTRLDYMEYIEKAGK